jgi:hypothetical protein
MPLTLVEIELLQVDESTRNDVRLVHAFLKNNPTLAFTPDEVAESINLAPHFVARVLHKLDDLDLVTLRFRDDQAYFRYLKDLPEID